MKRIFTLALISATCLLGAATDFTGTWRGELSVAQTRLPLVFHIASDTTATLDSPMQGAIGIPCTKATISGNDIYIEMQNLNAAYIGSIDTEGSLIKGHFTQNGMTFPLNLQSSASEETTLDRPQTPTPPFPYLTEEVTFSHDGITLAGTLSTPSSSTRHPAVVLVTGSGAQDRNETIMGHRPFAVIADHLTRAGIAVLRYDDRGAGKSSQGTPDDTSFDFAKDTEAAIDYLKTRPDIDPSRIGILGHSEGGLIAMIVASSRPDDVDFIVSLAGAATKGKDIVVKQNYAQYELAGLTPPEDEAAKIHAIFDAIDTIPDTDRLTAQLRTLLADSDMSPQSVDASIKAMTSPWYTTFIRFNPSETLRAVRCPVLALNGTWDVQVDAEANLSAIAESIPTATIKAYPELNHMFQESDNIAASTLYGEITQTISPQVLDDISAWIISITR